MKSVHLSLLLIIIILTDISYAANNCQEATFPIIVGGKSDPTRITAIAMQDSVMYVGGITSDNQLRDYDSISCATPLVMKYVESDGAFSVDWGRTLKTEGNFMVNGIAIPEDKQYVVVHAFSMT